MRNVRGRNRFPTKTYGRMVDAARIRNEFA
jgi:hypothetical protein